MPSWAIYGRERARGPGPATVSSSLDADTQNWITAVEGQGGSVSTPRKTIVNQLVLDLKAAACWTVTERLWLEASESEIQAKVSLATGNHIFTSVNNSPTFTVDEGYTGNGSNAYINTGWAPSTATIYALDSAFIACYFRLTPTANVATLFGCGSFPGNRSHIQPRFFGIADQSSVNTGDDGTFSLITAAKSVLYSRTSSSLTTRYVNEVADGTNSNTSTILQTLNFYILAANNGGGGGGVNHAANQVSIVGCGSGLDGTKAPAWQHCINTYMTALGKNVY